MPNVLRLRRSNAPEPNRNSEAIYAASDGTLKQVAPNGSETDLGGGGGGGSLTVTDGSTPVADVTEIFFTGAVTGDNGSGIVEVDIPPPGLAAVLDESNDGGGNGMTNTGGIATAGGDVDLGGGALVDATGVILADGSVPLTADWDAGDSGITTTGNVAAAEVAADTLNSVDGSAPIALNVPLLFPAGAPADGDIAIGRCGIYFDPTNGAAKLKFKGKTLNGTVVTGEVALAP